MLEVHAPHESIHSWKDFFIHITAIVIGLLIAVGLEQTVEYLHHKRQVTEVRAALLAERQINIGKFGLMTEEFHRVMPKMRTNLEVYKFLRLHPGASRDLWPGHLSWLGPTFGHVDGAWKTAQSGNILNYMPPAEVRRAADLYRRLESVDESFDSMREARAEVTAASVGESDPSKLTPTQIDAQIGLTSMVITRYLAAFTQMASLSRHYPDFQPSPGRSELFDSSNFDPDDLAKVNALLERNEQIERAFGGEGDAKLPATDALGTTSSGTKK
jgi:hypothetical protein